MRPTGKGPWEADAGIRPKKAVNPGGGFGMILSVV
jgi:hypothetical protein